MPKTPPASSSRNGIIYPKVTIGDVLHEYYISAKRHWLFFVLTTVSVVIAVVVGSIWAPLFYKKLFDLLSSAAPSSSIVSPLLGVIVAIFTINLTSWVFRRIRDFCLVHIEASVMTDLRQRAYEYVIGHSYAFFSNEFAGSLVQRINRFMRSFERIVERFFGEIVGLLVKVVGISIVLWYVKPVLSFAVIVWMLIFFVLSMLSSRLKIPYDVRAASAESKASGVLADSLSNHATIQLFDRHAHESSLFGLVNLDHKRSVHAKWTVGIMIDAAQSLMNVFLEFTIFYILIRLWGAGSMTVGTFVLIQIYILGLMDDFWGWSSILRDMYESFGDAKEMVEIMKLEHGIKDIPGAVPLRVSRGEIDIEGLTFEFNKDVGVLNGVSLHIRAGERVALVGPSGAGKSTLVRLLLRLYDIERGMISIDGQDIRGVTQGSLRQAISFVPQDPILFHRTLMENIRYGRTDATDEEVIRAATLAHCHEFIESFPEGYGTYVGERGVKLSGGERQRVAIARAILKDAPILVLDEATSSLDSHSESLIQEALDVLMKGKTVIVIAHRLSTIRKVDRIIVLEHGHIIEQGTHDALVAEGGLYAKLWSLQSEGFIK